MENITNVPFKTESPQLAQLRALSRKPNLVTIMIGGNDANFASTLFDCVLSHCVADGTIANDLAYIRSDTFKGQLTRTLTRVRAAAPQARVVLVGYPNLFPSYAVAAPRCGTFLTKNENAGLIRFAAALDAADRVAASAAHVRYDPVLNVLAGHELCTVDSWVNPLTLAEGPGAGHPNLQGQQAIEADVASYLGL